MLRRIALGATLVLLVTVASCDDADERSPDRSTVDTEMTVAQLFGITDDGLAVVAAHPGQSADFPLWTVDLQTGRTEPVFVEDADFVLSAALDEHGGLAAFDGSSPTRLLVADLVDGTYPSAEEIGTYDLDSESGTTWISEDELIFAAARPGEQTDLYLADRSSGDLRNMTNTPGVFEASPAVLRSERDHPVVAFIAAPVIGSSDVPDYGPTTIELAELVDGEFEALSGSDLGLDLGALEGQTLELVRSCPTTGCLVALGFGADRNARTICCVSAETHPLDLPLGVYRSPVVMADGRVAAVRQQGRIEVTSTTCS